ncbi:uncharacterized protein ELE39_001383 [Cryptosporidium sp. chipmunk genotype I]|uniref:uncharacterized protein n=1 Tax=Cryptosporidium sp. chipmunk genotype I TaxID=1280935 RepID=UPI003519F887|nr:hypothetical protein ELE39_001383 [Cryptosporidium sp. chipmunk genotype I]
MQPIGAFGMVPQLMNPPVVMVPGRNSGRSLSGNGSCCGGNNSKRKGSCSSCGRCFGSLLIILFAFICTSCCYAYPIYNSFTNPEYFKKQEEPIWTWKTALNKAKKIGYSMSLTKLPEDENVTSGNTSRSREMDGVQFLKLDSTDKLNSKDDSDGNTTTFINLENFLGKNSSNILLPPYNNSYISSLLYSNTERKLNIRGGGGVMNHTRDLVIGVKTKQTPNKYFNKEYCERGESEVSEGVWKELCNYKHNVTNLECIDMMNGPAICVGIRNRKYEVFSVSKQCKFVDPEIPVEIFPAISDICYNGKYLNGSLTTFNITKPLCPCMITSSPVDNLEFSGNTTTKTSTGTQDTRDFTLLNKASPETQKMLRGPEGIPGNSSNSSLIHFAAKTFNNNTSGNSTNSLLKILNS